MNTQTAETQHLVKLMRAQFGLPDLLLSVDPPQAVVSKIRPENALDDVRAEICDLGSFFSSPQAAGDWLTHHPDGAIAPVREDFEITRQAITQLGWAAD